MRSLAAILIMVGAMTLSGWVGNQATATDVPTTSCAFANGVVFHTALTTSPTTLTCTNNASI